MYKLTKLSDNKNLLRDDVIQCHTCSDIEVGKQVFLTAKPKDPRASVRFINTNFVVEILVSNDTVTEFKTASGSVYRVENEKLSKN